MVMDVRQYGSAKPFYEKLDNNEFPNISDPFDNARAKTYALYEDLYRNNPESFQIIIRGEDDEGNEVYVGTAKTVINTTCRYLGKGFKYQLSSDDKGLKKWLEPWWKRQAIELKHASNKRWGLVRGDELWFLRADSEAKEGERIELLELDPANYFPIVDEMDETHIKGCYIVDLVQEPGEAKGTMCARRQSYKYIDPDDENKGTIEYREDLYKLGKWDDRYSDPKDPGKDKTEHIKTLTEPKRLPEEIDHLPVYHIKPYSDQNAVFGTSELAGSETLMVAINQSYSDEDLAMAVRGLGVWSTDSGPPTDDLGRPTEWEISPARVVERDQGTSFDLVTGVPTVEPSQSHIRYAQEAIQRATGTPEVAVGMQDVVSQISGVALKLHFDPMVARVHEMHLERTGKLDQMWHDLIHKWLPAYESISLGKTLTMTTSYEDPMPVDVDAEMERILKLWEAKLISGKTAIKMLNERCGLELEDGEFEKAVKDAEKVAKSADPFGAQMAEEKNTPDDAPGAPATNGRAPTPVGG